MPRLPDEELLKDLVFETVWRLACRSMRLEGRDAVQPPMMTRGRETTWMIEFEGFLAVGEAIEFCSIQPTKETKETKETTTYGWD